MCLVKIEDGKQELSDLHIGGFVISSWCVYRGPLTFILFRPTVHLNQVFRSM